MKTAIARQDGAAPFRPFALPLRRWLQVAGERRHLARLDEAQLRDIGLTRADARRESVRPFWDFRPR